MPLPTSAGAVPNYGWPCVEGDTPTSLPGLEQEASPWHGVRRCERRGAPRLLRTVPARHGWRIGDRRWLPRPAARSPAARGRYLFGDYAQNFIRTADLSDEGEISDVSTLGNSTAADGPVKFLTGPDGLLWTVSIFSGSLRRLRYTGEGLSDRCPAGSFRRTFHDLDGPDSVFDQDFPDDEWRWLYPYAAAQLPTQALADPTCETGVKLAPTTGSPWATTAHPDTRAHPGDRYGTAWRGRIDVDSGTYRFTVKGSEWIRLWVDDELLHDFYSNDFWDLEDTRQHDVVLARGEHSIRAELVHGDESVASADVTWQRIGGPPQIPLTSPANGFVAAGGAVPWRVTVSDPDGDSQQSLADKVQLSVDFLHYSGGSYHVHPVARVDGFTGTVPVDDTHAPGSGLVRLRATATDASGARTTSAPVYVCFPNGAVGPCQR